MRVRSSLKFQARQDALDQITTRQSNLKVLTDADFDKTFSCCRLSLAIRDTIATLGFRKHPSFTNSSRPAIEPRWREIFASAEGGHRQTTRTKLRQLLPPHLKLIHPHIPRHNFAPQLSSSLNVCTSYLPCPTPNYSNKQPDWLWCTLTAILRARLVYVILLKTQRN